MGAGRLAAQSYEVISRWGKVGCYFNSGVCSFKNNHYLCGDFKCRLSPPGNLVTVEHIPEQDVINDVAYS